MRGEYIGKNAAPPLGESLVEGGLLYTFLNRHLDIIPMNPCTEFPLRAVKNRSIRRIKLDVAPVLQIEESFVLCSL
jgi:hypothetical protein